MSYTKNTDFKVGDRGSYVLAVQQQFARMRDAQGEPYFTGEPNGVFGPDMEACLRRFQRDAQKLNEMNGSPFAAFPETGHYDESTKLAVACFGGPMAARSLPSAPEKLVPPVNVAPHVDAAKAALAQPSVAPVLLGGNERGPVPVAAQDMVVKLITNPPIQAVPAPVIVPLARPQTVTLTPMPVVAALEMPKQAPAVVSPAVPERVIALNTPPLLEVARPETLVARSMPELKDFTPAAGITMATMDAPSPERMYSPAKVAMVTEAKGNPYFKDMLNNIGDSMKPITDLIPGPGAEAPPSSRPTPDEVVTAPLHALDEALHPKKRIHPIPPLAGMAEVSRRFGNIMHPILGFVKPHAGLDFIYSDQRKQGDMVAVFDGSVYKVDRSQSGGEGRQVVIQSEDGQWRASYSHSSSIVSDLKPGDPVRAGEHIANMGMTGHYANGKRSATGEHLHFEMKRRVPGTDIFVSVNPMQFYEFVEDKRGHPVKGRKGYLVAPDMAQIAAAEGHENQPARHRPTEVAMNGIPAQPIPYDQLNGGKKAAPTPAQFATQEASRAEPVSPSIGGNAGGGPAVSTR